MFKHRFISLNAKLFEEWLRTAADQVHALIPGPPVLSYITFKQEGNLIMASIEVVDTVGDLNASVAFLDAHGHPTTADDIPAWSSDNEAAATVAAAADGLSAVVSVLAPGAAIISVSTVNTDGSVASAQGTITVLPGDAFIGEVSFVEAPDVEPEPEPEPEL